VVALTLLLEHTSPEILGIGKLAKEQEDTGLQSES